MDRAIDPRLNFLLERHREQTLAELRSSGRFGLATPRRQAVSVRVLLRFRGESLEPLEREGFQPATVAGDVATGLIELDRLEDLASLPEVVHMEASRPLTGELETSVREIGAHLVHAGTDGLNSSGLRGAGVLVGIIDTGLDYLHENFIAPDGTSRIVAIWDQALEPEGAEQSPEGFGYGVEYSKAEIDQALAAADPAEVVRHGHDPNFLPIVNRARLKHGTHVAGIVAGDGSMAGGSSGSSRPSFTYVGVAPEADIVFVANRAGTEALGDSASTLDACAYIFAVAEALGRPAVINLSQGDNLGAHDGSSLLERGIDNLLGAPGRAIVKSSGNAAGRGVHAAGRVRPGGRERLRFRVPAHDPTPDTIDIWYAAGDRLALEIKPPRRAGRASRLIEPGETVTLEIGDNQVFVDSIIGDPANDDNRIYLQLSRGAAASLAQGDWTLILHGDSIQDGHFDAWIERGGLSPQFIGSHRQEGGTLTIPGTSHAILTVGSYITKGAGVGDLSSFSSYGPTRDGRRKPEITAPGQWIESVMPTGSSSAYGASAGTSLAAPHVAGAIALMFQKDPSLTQGQIRDLIEGTARRDGRTGAPNERWGAGRLDAHAAVKRVEVPC